MTNQNKDYSWLDELFGDIRSTCEDCEHPRCISRIKSAKFTLQSHIDEHYIGKGETERDFEHINTMISEYIRSTWPDGNVLRASEGKPINWEPLVRQIRDYAAGKFGHGKRLQSMIDKTDAILDKLDPKMSTESEVEQRCIEARLAENKENLSGFTHLAKDDFYRKEWLVDYFKARDDQLKQQLSTNNKDTLERSE